MGVIEPVDSTNGNKTKACEKLSDDNKDNSQNGGGNCDSGYHSFSCSSNCCCQKSSQEMLTTTSLGHNDDFNAPLRHNGYPTNIITGRYIEQSNDEAKVISDRGYNSLPDASLYSSQFIKRDTSSPSSEKNYPLQDSQKNDPKTMEQEAAKVMEKIEFCFKLGYTVQQVRAILLKIGHNASKNDILMALGDAKLAAAGSDISSNESRGETIELIARGPSTVEDEGKEDDSNTADNLRPIVIDGSNVAMSHGNKEYFSCKGIQFTVQYFLDRGHRDITVFVPNYRKEQSRPDAPIKDQEILTRLQDEKILVWTPSRHVNGRRITCYDDRFILKLAQVTDGVIVSNDNFRDLQNEKPEWKEVIEKRLLMYSFVNDRFMPPDDPLGRNGPSIDNFLRIRSLSEEKKKPECPYGKKCTYGKKCKYFHPECSFSQKSVSEQMKDRPAASLVARNLATEFIKDSSLGGPASTQHGAQKTSRQETSGSTISQSRVDTRPTTALANLGVYGHDASHLNLHGPSVGQLSTPNLAAEFNNKVNIRPYNPYPQSGGYGNMGYPPYHENNSNGAEGQNSNPMSRMGQLAPPALHSQVGRAVVSSAAPHHPHQNFQQPLNLHHSSPPAIPMYERGYMQPSTMHPYQQNMTYPSLAQQHFAPPPQPAYPSNHDMLLYHQAMLNHHLYMSHMGQDTSRPIAPQTNSQPHASYPYPYPMQSMPQSNLSNPGNLTTPRHMDSTMFEEANRQHYSSPIPMTPQHMLQRSMQPHKLATIPQSRAQQPDFKDPSNPRYHLFKNLCGLFSQRIVERVLKVHTQENDAKTLAKACLDMDKWD